VDIRALLDATDAAMTGAGVRHALIGALALGAHGVRRMTSVVDWLVHGEDRLSLKRALFGLGFSLVEETPESTRFGGPGAVDVVFANRPVTKDMLITAPRLPGRKFRCLSAEALIGLKIHAYKHDAKRAWRDKADIQALIEANRRLDWTEIKGFADLFDEWPAIEAIRRLVVE
jgi:hypothetical protein